MTYSPRLEKVQVPPLKVDKGEKILSEQASFFFFACGFHLISVLGQTHMHDDDDDVESWEALTNTPSPPVLTPAARTKNSTEKERLLTQRRTHRAAVINLAVALATTST